VNQQIAYIPLFQNSKITCFFENLFHVALDGFLKKKHASVIKFPSANNISINFRLMQLDWNFFKDNSFNRIRHIPALFCGVGLDDPQRSLPSPNIR